MGYFEDAKQLVQYAKDQFPQIEEAYNISLEDLEIKPKLLIEIKNLMENLRSALEFTAHGLFKKYGYSDAAKQKTYFPYSLDNQTKEQFLKSNRIKKCIPGINASRPDVVEKITSYQHFADINNRWLPIFMELNNENKHQQLTPQGREESKELRISSEGSSISMKGGASISLGSGASIEIGKMTIPGGQNIDVNNPPITYGPGKKEVITWVSFIFSTNQEPVLPFLRQSIDGTDKIVNELSSM